MCWKQRQINYASLSVPKGSQTKGDNAGLSLTLLARSHPTSHDP